MMTLRGKGHAHIYKCQLKTSKNKHLFSFAVGSIPDCLLHICIYSSQNSLKAANFKKIILDNRYCMSVFIFVIRICIRFFWM